jgi:hypothetical protein
MSKVALSTDHVGVTCDIEGNTNMMSWKVKREGSAILSITCTVHNPLSYSFMNED